jgi:hypothetical protein
MGKTGEAGAAMGWRDTTGAAVGLEMTRADDFTSS